jgi:pimeloyl-ACP methyl ester carboxylesterase
MALNVMSCSTPRHRPPVATIKSTSAHVSSAAAPVTTASSANPDIDLAARCGSRRAQRLLRSVTGPGGARLPVIDVGHGTTVAVFLHQIDGDGLCGWWPYAAWLTGRFGVRAVLIDLCGYGRAHCPAAFADDQQRQVALAVAHARAAPTRRVVIVGASMGGALALASADAVHADAVVDLSGPTEWPHAASMPAARRLHVPCLIAASPNDLNIDYSALHTAYLAIPASRKAFVRGDGLHGWDLLGDTTKDPPAWRPLATTVAHWITRSAP